MPLPGKDDTEKLGDFEIFPQVKYHGDVDMIAQSYDAKMGIMAQLFTNL